MKLFERILFPLDFSDRCSQTSCWVGEIARSLGSELTLLHVFEAYDSLELGVGSQCHEEDVFKSLFEARRRRLRNFGKDCFEGVTVSRLVSCGNAAECIVKCAKNQGIQLIVMPTHGEGSFRRLLAGSVTLKVLHDADCAVWTTAHADALAMRPPLQIRKILCAVDLSSESSPVLSTAVKLGSIYGASLHLVHTIPVAEETRRRESEGQLNSLAENAAREFAAEGGSNRLSFETSVGVGPIADIVRDRAAQLPADLVITGHGRSRKHFGEFWSHLGSIIHESPCSVLSI